MAGLDLASLEASLEGEQAPAPVYLLLGPGVWTREQAILRLRQAALGAAAGEPGAVVRVRAGEGDLARILDAARTLPMTLPRRFMVMGDVETLGAADLDLLAAYAAHPCSTTCLVLSAADFPARSTVAKAVLAAVVRVDCRLPRSYEIPRWLADELRRRGRTCEPGVPELLQEILGDDQATLAAGLDKVLLYVGEDRRPLTRTDVATVLDRLPHGTVWEFVEALEEKNAARALQALHAILEMGEPPESILRLILRSRRQLLAGLAARRRGIPPEEVLAAMGVHPKARAVPRLRRAILERLAAHHQAEVVAALPRLLEADSRLKGAGGEPAHAALTRLVLDLVGGGRPRAGNP